MQLTIPRLTITTFSPDMAQNVYENSQDDDTRRFVPDEVYASVEEARAAIEFLTRLLCTIFLLAICCHLFNRKPMTSMI